MFHFVGFWVQQPLLCSVINIEDYFLFDIERSVLLNAPADGALQLLQWAPVPMTRCPWQRNSHTLPRPVSIFSPKTQIGGFPFARQLGNHQLPLCVKRRPEWEKLSCEWKWDVTAPKTWKTQKNKRKKKLLPVVNNGCCWRACHQSC